MKPKLFRKFLTTPSKGSDAYITVSFTDRYLSIKFADCNRSVHIGFDPDERKKFEVLKQGLEFAEKFFDVQK